MSSRPCPVPSIFILYNNRYPYKYNYEYYPAVNLILNGMFRPQIYHRNEIFRSKPNKRATRYGIGIKLSILYVCKRVKIRQMTSNTELKPNMQINKPMAQKLG